MSEMREKQVTELCSACSSIDWSPLLEPPGHASSDTGHFLRSVGCSTDKNVLAPTCPICTSLQSITPKLVLRYKLQARLYHLDKDGWITNAERKRRNRASKSTALNESRSHDCQASDVESQLPAIMVVRHNPKYKYAKGKMSEAGERGFMIGAADITSHPVRAVKRGEVNYDVFRTFLSHCEQQHDTTISGALPAPLSLADLYVIDVDALTIVTLPAGAAFIALSYVWGQQNQANTAPRRSRNEYRTGVILDETSLPLTIRDAILATQMLGRRFLWVDRYCINLADHAHQAAMIENMDKIYAGAELTIVALSGRNADAGLPGVSSVLRKQQEHFTAGGLTWRSTLPGLKALIRDSTWSTRGWTYQEARLSRTCLFFTDQQVYCVCKHRCISESLPSESEVCGLSSMFNAGLLDSRLLSTSDELSFDFEDRFAYSQRVLSFDADVLNAFTGLLNRQPFFHISGQPVTVPDSNLTACTGFAMGLLWSTPKNRWASTVVAFKRDRNRCTRRSGFPSWSWASVNGTVISEHIAGRDTIYRQFLKGVAAIENQPLPSAHFHVANEQEEGGACVDLCHVQRLWKTNQVMNLNVDSVVVDGEVVRVRLICDSYGRRISHFRCCDKEGTLTPHIPRWKLEEDSIGIQDVTIDIPSPYLESEDYIQLDDPALSPTDLATIREAYYDKEVPGLTMRTRSIGTKVHDALVLIDWQTDTLEGETRWVLMLLKWLDDGTAERVGILGNYWTAQDVKCIDQVPRERKRFTLV